MWIVVHEHSNLCPDICFSESMNTSTNAFRILTCFSLYIFYFTINHHTYLWFLTYLVTWDPLVNICLTYIYILLYYVALGNYNCSFISSAVSMASVVSLCLMLLHGWHTRMFQLGTMIYAGIQRTGLNKWFGRLSKWLHTKNQALLLQGLWKHPNCALWEQGWREE